MAHLTHWARLSPDKVAAHFPDTGQAVTYAALDARANRVAQWLIGLGLAPGEGIALLLDNRPEFLEIAEGVKRAGLYYTPLSIHLRPHEVAYVLRDSGARVLVVSPAVAELAVALVAEGAVGDRPCFAVGQGLAGYHSYEAALAAQEVSVSLPERPLGREFLYSSGTTGLPKGIRRPLIPWVERDRPEWDMSWKDRYGFGEDTVYLSPRAALPRRAKPLRRAHPGVGRHRRRDGALRHGPVAGADRALPRHPQPVGADDVRAPARPAGGAPRAARPCLPPLRHPRSRALPRAGEARHDRVVGSDPARVLRRIGGHRDDRGRQRHLAAQAGHGRPAHQWRARAHPGRRRPRTAARPDRPRVLRRRPALRLPQRADKTAASYDSAGRTTLGDLGWLDADGFLYLSDRRTDLILSGGVNLYPAEIEAVLVRHPGVAEVAVVGIPHPEMGEQVHAVVVPRGDADAAALDAWCREHLAGPKRPRSYEFVSELPRSEAGKLLRRILKERYLSSA